MNNLNELAHPSDGNYPEIDSSLELNRVNDTLISCECEVYFDNLQDILIEKINNFPVILGCVAWLTNEPILRALQSKEKVSIIIQKEDFLRPDSGNWRGEKLRSLYQKIPKGVVSGDVPGVSVLCGWETDSIRWMGKFNHDRAKAFPRMHNKFLVFCDRTAYNEETCFNSLIPKAVWTGSLNLTHNSTNSLENAVYLNSEEVANRYFLEWTRIFLLSEEIPAEAWGGTWQFDSLRVGT